MKEGIYKGMSFDEYRAIKAVNKSSLDHVNRSLAHYQAAQHIQKPPTAPMRLGSAAHCLILEPDLFDQHYMVIPSDAPKRPTAAQLKAKKPSQKTLDQINWWSIFDGATDKRTLLSVKDFDTAARMRVNLRRKSAFTEFFSEGDAEVVLVWTDEETGLLCKGRADWRCEGAIVDLKTTMNASKRDFVREIFDRRYHVQGAFYLDGLEKLTGESAIFVFAGIEKEEPFESNFFYLSDGARELGRRAYRRNLKRYHQGITTGIWPGYENQLIAAEPPGYVVTREEDEE